MFEDAFVYDGCYSAFRRLLADDMLIEFGDNLARRQLVECEFLFFGGCG